MKPVLTLISSAIIPGIIAAMFSLATTPATAQALQDPWLPPSARSLPTAPETRGAALRGQVMAKLEARFRAADAAGRGTVTLAQAQAAGWGFAVRNFAALDTRGRGEIRIQDLQEFVRKQGQLK